MLPVNVPLTKAFSAACRRYGLQPLPVLEAFTGALSVEVSLFAGGGLPFLAAQVFSLFTNSVPPVIPLHPVKRERGVRYLRQMVKVERSWVTNEEKSARHKVLMNAWLCLNGLHCTEKNLRLSPALTLSLTEYYLLLCDLFRCPPQAPLCFFMQQVVSSTEQSIADCPAVQMMLYCAEAMGTTTGN